MKQHAPLYTKVIRQIIYDNPQGLWAIDKTGISRIDDLLEYCKVLRSSLEVYKFLGMSGIHSRDYYLKPLIEQGKLKIIAPPKKNRTNQFYLNAEVDEPTNVGDAICYYCRSPRHLRDIVRHFGLTTERFTDIAMQLIASGKLLGSVDNLTDKERVGISYKARYFISELAMQRKGNAIMEFCQVPRTRDEMQEFMGMTSEYYIHYLQPLICSGRLLLTKPDQLKSVDQKFVTAEFMVPDIKVLSADNVQEYCRTPRTRVEITKHFVVKNYIAERFIERMLEKGGL